MRPGRGCRRPTRGRRPPTGRCPACSRSARAGPLDRGVAVGHAVRCGRVEPTGERQRRERVAEPRLLAGEQCRRGREREHRRHEVVLRRAFFESTDQVRDRDVELARVDDRRVEQQRPDGAPDGLGLPLRHPEEHLELDAVTDPALPREQPRVRDVEQVVPGDPDAHVLDARRGERPVEDALVVRVGVLLGVPRREGPPVHRCLDLLHGQVRTLDEPDLDVRAAAGPAGGGPLLQLLHRGERVGQVRLQHDARFERGELRLVEELREDRDRQVEVLVLLHVEVDELRRARRGRTAEQRPELLDDVVDRVVERPRRVRVHGRRDLDRDVVDVVPGEQPLGALEPSGRLLLAEHRFAEQVHVEADAVALDLRDGRSELGVGRVDDQVADHVAQHPSRDRDDDVRQDRRHPAAEPDESAERGRQEPGCVRRDRSELARCDAEVLRAHDAVDEPDGERQALRVREHARELLGRAVHRVGLGLGQPLPDERDGGVGEGIGSRRGVRVGARLDVGHGLSVVPTKR